MSDGEASDSPIEGYLDQLVQRMASGPPRDLRHLLAETEAHLRDDAAAAVVAGLSPEEAERLAVARFGSAGDVAGADGARMLTPIPAVLGQAALSALLLGGIGALAVGASGLVAAIIRAVAGTRVLVDVAPGQNLSAADCARWLAADPAAHSCRDAAVSDWAAETVFYRIAVGLLGVICVVAYRWVRRRPAGRRGPSALPSPVSSALAAAIFGAAAIWTLALGLQDVVTTSGHGSGQWLSAALVAGVAALVFGMRLLADLRELGPATGMQPIGR